MKCREIIYDLEPPTGIWSKYKRATGLRSKWGITINHCTIRYLSRVNAQRRCLRNICRDLVIKNPLFGAEAFADELPFWASLAELFRAMGATEMPLRICLFCIFSGVIASDSIVVRETGMLSRAERWLIFTEMAFNRSSRSWHKRL